MQTPVYSTPVPVLSSAELTAAVKSRATALGFDLVGIAPAVVSARADYFADWLDTGKAGEMHYMAERLNERLDPAALLPGAKSVIALGKLYERKLLPPQRGGGRVARYALGTDYHDWLLPKTHELADWLREISPGCHTKCGVDSTPITEKPHAAAAGLGWIGKNTLLLNKRVGSYLFLACIVTTADLLHDAAATDHCGSCTRCIDACPTGAINAPYQLDATRCISYLTIEHRGGIPPELAPAMGDWLFGCDICQEVCPFNAREVAVSDIEAFPRLADGAIDAQRVLDWQPADFHPVVRRSAMKRVKLAMLKRNARIVVNNIRARESAAASHAEQTELNSATPLPPLRPLSPQTPA